MTRPVAVPSVLVLTTTTIYEGMSTRGRLKARDPDGSFLTCSLIDGGAPQIGRFQLDPNGEFFYNIDDFDPGEREVQDSFTYEVRDADGEVTATTV